MVVRDKLYGGTTNAYGSVYVGGQLGNKAALSTKVYLGYDPLSIRQLEKIDKIIAQLSQTITHLNAIAGHLPPETNDASRKLQALRLQRRQLINRRDELWSRLAQDENYMFLQNEGFSEQGWRTAVHRLAALAPLFANPSS